MFCLGVFNLAQNGSLSTLFYVSSILLKTEEEEKFYLCAMRLRDKKEEGECVLSA